jgi:hypothetical protein
MKLDKKLKILGIKSADMARLTHFIPNYKKIYRCSLGVGLSTNEYYRCSLGVGLSTNDSVIIARTNFGLHSACESFQPWCAI